MNVLLVTTWKTDCGIAEHSAMLRQAVQAADPEIVVMPYEEGLDPTVVVSREDWINPKDAVVHLNYHAALHSRWAPEWIRRIQAYGVKVLVTYHDSGVPNADQCKAVCTAADYFVLHEPYDDLGGNGEYLRMGVPSLDDHVPYLGRERWKKAYPDQLFLGSVGFPFPWKSYEELARVTAAAEWGLFLIAPRATSEQIDQWRAINPYTVVRNDFLCRKEVVRLLHDCDATAFTYGCANTGQSGAILQGIAARKPVIAFSHCRQMRSLYLDPLGQEVILWCQTFDDVALCLRNMQIQRVDPGIAALAAQDSWTKVGERYSQIYRSLS